MDGTWDESVEGSTLAEADARTSSLVLGAARWRLVVGGLLERFGVLGGPRGLGFSSMAAYAVERCGASGRWVEEARGLPPGRGAPRVKAALTGGEITWSMAQLLARHATPGSEAALVEVARGCTIRNLRLRLEPRAAPAADEPAPRRTVETIVDAEDAWAFKRAKVIVREVTDDASGDEVVEAMLGETLSSLLPMRPSSSRRSVGRGGASGRRATRRSPTGSRRRSRAGSRRAPRSPTSRGRVCSSPCACRCRCAASVRRTPS